MTNEEMNLYFHSNCRDIIKYEKLINKRNKIRKQLAHTAIKRDFAVDVLALFDDDDYKSIKQAIRKVDKAKKDIAKFHHLELELFNVNTEINDLLSI